MNKKTSAAGFDLALIDKPEAITHRVPVMLDDDGEGIVGFVIVSKDTPQYIAVAQRLRVSGIKRQAVKGERIDTGTDAGALQFDNMVRDNETELAASVVVDWFGFTNGGAPAAFDPAMVRNALAARPSWRNKVMIALEVEANFLPK